MSVQLAVPGGGPADPGLSFTVNCGPSFGGSSAFGNGGALSVNRTLAKLGSVEAQVVAGDGSRYYYTARNQAIGAFHRYS